MGWWRAEGVGRREKHGVLPGFAQFLGMGAESEETPHQVDC